MDETARDTRVRNVPFRAKASEPAGDPAAVANYIASLSEELSRLARGNGLTTLAYILEMARLEAGNVIVVKVAVKYDKEP